MITVKMNLDEIRKKFNYMQKQVNFAASKAINDTLIDSQKEQLSWMEQSFTIRRPGFAKKSVKISKFAKKDDLTGIIEIAGVGGKQTQDIWAKFEKGGTKRSRSGHNIAIPTATVQPIKTKVVTKGKRPSNLKKSFKLTTKKGQELIMVKKGRGKNERVEVAYILEPSAKINDNLDFYQNVGKTIELKLEKNWSYWFDRALATAK